MKYERCSCAPPALSHASLCLGILDAGSAHVVLFSFAGDCTATMASLRTAMLSIAVGSFCFWKGEERLQKYLLTN